jgi:excisionase family DNA binding protein
MKRKTEEVPRMLAMPSHLQQRLERALNNYHQDLERLHSALQGFEEALQELEEEGVLQELEEEGALDQKKSASSKHENDQDRRLLSVAEVCLKLGSDRTSVCNKLSSGEIPSLRLGDHLKVRPRDLEEYINGQRCCRRPRSLALVGQETNLAEP